jgi:DNA gyrase inhibitor GyrI
MGCKHDATFVVVEDNGDGTTTTAIVCSNCDADIAVHIERTAPASSSSGVTVIKSGPCAVLALYGLLWWMLVTALTADTFFA